MPDSEYVIKYSAPADRIGRDVDTIIRHLTRLDAAIDKSQAKFKGLGGDLAGLAKFTQALQAIQGQLRATASASNSAEKELKDIGKGNTAVTSLTARVKLLEAQLKAAEAAALAAAAAMSGVGGGGTGGGSGGGGGGGKKPFMTPAKYMAVGVAMQGLRKVGSAASESIGNRREYLKQATDAAQAFREDLREVGNLQGKTSVDDALIREQIAFQKATGLNPEEARDLRLEFGGAIAPGMARGNINQGTADELEKQAGKFGLRYDLDMKTTGRMAGLLSNYGKIPDAASGLGTMAESAELMNIYGLGSVKSMMSSMVGLSADMLDSEEGGRFGSFSSLSARFAATTFTAKTPAAAATQIRQANRLLRKFNGKDEEAFLRAQGVTPEDDYETALRRIAPKILGPNGDQVLMQAGFGNSTERDSVIKQARNIPVVDKALSDPRMAGARANAVLANDAFAGTVTGRQRAAENADFESAIETGLAGERMKTARTAARARMADPRQPGGQQLKAGIVGSILDFAQSTMTTYGGVSGEELRIDEEAMAGLIKGGQQVGVDVRKIAPTAAYRMDSGQPLDTDAARGDFNRAWQAVEQAGGDPMGGAPKRAAAALRNAANAVEALENRGGNRGPAMGPPPGNGGAGFNPGRR